MQSPEFDVRKARILEERRSHQRRRTSPAARRIGGLALALCAALVCFFVLKGATLAYFGDEGFARLTAATSAPSASMPEGSPALRFWLSGIDPVSRVIADALSPALSGSRALSGSGSGSPDPNGT